MSFKSGLWVHILVGPYSSLYCSPYVPIYYIFKENIQVLLFAHNLQTQI